MIPPLLASQRANKGRKNYKNRGLTASIFLQDRLGGKQIGTLVHVMGTRQGWCLLDSIPDQKAVTIGPLIRKSLPISTAVFTDEGYPWLYRVYRNHRMVNHSLKSKDNRWRFSRERWSRKGVHNQIAEGLNSSLKSAMAGYRYFKPEYSKLYLNEWSFFKNINYFGFEKISGVIRRGKMTPIHYREKKAHPSGGGKKIAWCNPAHLDSRDESRNGNQKADENVKTDGVVGGEGIILRVSQTLPTLGNPTLPA